MEDANSTKMPVSTGSRLSRSQSPESQSSDDPKHTDVTEYRMLVGKLVYAMVGTRPDIAFAVSQCSRFFANPGKAHLRAAKHVLRYLKGTANLGLTYGRSSGHPTLDPYAYCDSDWAQCPDTRRSTSGYVIMLNGSAISWLSKRQPTVALSSAEAEYVTACFAAQEVQFIRQTLKELELLKTHSPTTIYCDSQSAIHMIGNPTSGRAKHIDIKAHFVKETQERGVTNFTYIHTNANAADMLTKALSGPKTIHFRDIISGCRSAVTSFTKKSHGILNQNEEVHMMHGSVLDEESYTTTQLTNLSAE